MFTFNIETPQLLKTPTIYYENEYMLIEIHIFILKLSDATFIHSVTQ